MKKTILIAIFLSAILAACDNHQSRVEDIKQAQQKSPDEIKKEQSIELLNSISGVWSGGRSLVTIYYSDNQMQFIIDETPILVKIGDVDPENQTVNLLVNKKIDNEEAILTIKKKDNVDGTAFTLLITSFVDGSNQEFSFVRKIGTDDKNRISRIYKKAQDEADEIKRQQEQVVLESEKNNAAQVESQYQKESQNQINNSTNIDESVSEPSSEETTQ